jgi:hypothetical protein
MPKFDRLFLYWAAIRHSPGGDSGLGNLSGGDSGCLGLSGGDLERRDPWGSGSEDS